MQTTTQAREIRINAGVILDNARKHRARIGALIMVKSPAMLLDWYESALDAEEKAREVYGAAIDAERMAQMRAAYLI